MRSMPNKITDNSVGIIAPINHHFDQPLTLASGKVLPAFDVVYETYGELNSNASNAILICHALSGDHHAAGYHSMDDAKPGWWDNYIGPGKVIDTNKFFVVSPNNIGGCAGSTGPASINPETARPWGASFPRLRARDWVNVQARLADVLGIQQWAAVIGGSLGEGKKSLAITVRLQPSDKTLKDADIEAVGAKSVSRTLTTPRTFPSSSRIGSLERSVRRAAWLSPVCASFV